MDVFSGFWALFGNYESGNNFLFFSFSFDLSLIGRGEARGKFKLDTQLSK